MYLLYGFCNALKIFFCTKPFSSSEQKHVKAHFIKKKKQDWNSISYESWWQTCNNFLSKFTFYFFLLHGNKKSKIAEEVLESTIKVNILTLLHCLGHLAQSWIKDETSVSFFSLWRKLNISKINMMFTVDMLEVLILVCYLFFNHEWV